MLAFGFSVNSLTLLMMVLAIGLVVENLHRHIEEGKTPLAAAMIGAREVARPVIEILKRIALRRPLSQMLKTDNGSELKGKILDNCVCKRGIRIDISRPGTPTDNDKVESFNGRLRQECLNENWSMSLEDVR